MASIASWAAQIQRVSQSGEHSRVAPSPICLTPRALSQPFRARITWVMSDHHLETFWKPQKAFIQNRDLNSGLGRSALPLQCGWTQDSGKLSSFPSPEMGGSHLQCTASSRGGLGARWETPALPTNWPPFLSLALESSSPAQTPPSLPCPQSPPSGMESHAPAAWNLIQVEGAGEAAPTDCLCLVSAGHLSSPFVLAGDLSQSSAADLSQR